MFVLFILIALFALATTLALPAIMTVAPAMRVHVAFALGVMPLILAAFDYFVPVLTRSGASAQPAKTLPWLALTAGAMAIVQFLLPDALPFGFMPSALCALVAAAGSAWWMRTRGAATLGQPHPCLHWYVASALCLAGGVGAILAAQGWPEAYAELRRVHLHLNTLGFVGLAAIGTLQVLMPTVAAQPDPGVAARLRRDLLPAVLGTVLVAGGTAWFLPLAWVGLVLYFIPLARLWLAWWRLHRGQMFAWHGAAPALAGAFIGLIALSALQAGLRGGVPQAAFVFIAAFLMPLVTGAASALLPVLLRPGAQTPWHAAFRLQAGRYAGIRALLFLAGGLVLATGRDEGVVLSLLALVLFVAQLSRALRTSA